MPGLLFALVGLAALAVVLVVVALGFLLAWRNGQDVDVVSYRGFTAKFFPRDREHPRRPDDD